MTARAWTTALLVVGALVILGYGGQSLTRVWHLKREVEHLEHEIAGLRAETAELSTEVARLRSDPESIEKVAREQLGLVKPGERVLKLPPSLGGH